MLFSITCIVASYLVGSIASAIIVCRLLGLPDPRDGGSGNPGATNVLRLGGKKAAAITLAGDVLKGLLPVLAVNALGADATTTALAGVAAFLGHLFPVFFGFKGGKGFATAIGVVAGLSWIAVLAMLLSWAAVAAIFRISSLSSLVSSVVVPIAMWFATGSWAYVGAGIAIAVLVFIRHQGNIQRLIAGTEPRIGKKA